MPEATRWRVFLDANILFSAAKSAGAERALLQLLIDRDHECWVDEYVVAEARRNLQAKGPDALVALDARLPLLRRAGTPRSLITSAGRDLDWLPEKDRPVLAAAIRLRCDRLVTGDRTHFGVGYGRSYGGVRVCSPRQLLDDLP